MEELTRHPRRFTLVKGGLEAAQGRHPDTGQRESENSSGSEASARRVPTRDADGYAPISDYGFLSDCRSCALISSDGSVDWLCWPRFDSPSLFGAILDPVRGGRFQICPASEPYTVTREYVHATNVLQTTFHTPDGTLKLTDWMHVGARQALCRQIECLSGQVDVGVDFDPRPDYGQHGPVAAEEKLGWLTFETPDGHRMVVSGLTSIGAQVFTMTAGEEHDIVVGLDRPGPSDLDVSMARAVAFWQDWADDLCLPEFGRDMTLRSALVLKGLQYQPSGAIVAAATTSLPEDPGGERNWDYRYSWLRDATFTLGALHAVGSFQEAQSWFGWLKTIALHSGVEDLQIMYGIGGEENLAELTLDHLDGYRHSQPVRIGNGAARQRQIDTYGEVADAIWQQRGSSRKPVGPHRWAILKAMADRAAQDWRKVDEGIWEVRGEPQHFVYSKAMCWVALDRAIRIAELDGHRDCQLDDWLTQRDLIHAEVMQLGYDERLGAFTQSYGSGTLDASNLQLGLCGFIDPQDPRFVSTVRSTQRELTRGGLVDRYRAAETDDGLTGGEGTFVLCSMWLCLALTKIGDRQAARELYDRVAGCANDLGLLAEELTPEGEQLGNYPQAFSHIGMILCAFALDQAQEGSEPTFAAAAGG